MSYYSHPHSPTCYSSTTSSSASAELKVYQAFLFSIPIFFTFILLLFYLFYLRPRRVDWSSLRMRLQNNNNNNDLSGVELGLKKELREMLLIIIYKESFSIRDIQWSVCLGEYRAEDKLQQIPACGHAIHMDCIDHWLATHTTCPLCRLSLLPPAKTPSEMLEIQETSRQSSVTENSDNTSNQHSSLACGEAQAIEHLESMNGDARDLQNSTPKEQGRSTQCFDQESNVQDTRNETEEHEHSRGIAGNF